MSASALAGGLNDAAADPSQAYGGLSGRSFVSQRGPATLLAAVHPGPQPRRNRATPANEHPAAPRSPDGSARLSAPAKPASRALVQPLVAPHTAVPPRALVEPLASRKPVVRPNGRPVRVGRVTSRYGWRSDPLKGGRRFHSGTDFAAPQGTPILSVADGVVTFAGVREHYGNVVEVYHGQGLLTRYAHNFKNLAKVGDRVERGDLIARVGMTGRTTGPHVHFEVRQNNRPVDPTPYILGQPAAEVRISLNSKK